MNDADECSRASLQLSAMNEGSGVGAHHLSRINPHGCAQLHCLSCPTNNNHNSSGLYVCDWANTPNSIQESPWRCELRALALKASCRRLAAAATLAHLPHVAAPELLRVLRVAEEGSGTDSAEVDRIPARLWQAVVPQLFSHLASTKVSQQMLP